MARLPMDTRSACDGAYHPQKYWIDQYNTQHGEYHERRMASSADILLVPERAHLDVFISLQQDIKESRIITCTHILYSPETARPLSGQVTHHYRSTIVTPTTTCLDEIPILKQEPITIIERNTKRARNTLNLLRALADEPNASPSRLLERLIKLAHRQPQEIVLTTPDIDARTTHPARGVGFYEIWDTFIICADYINNAGGRTHGIAVQIRPTHAPE